MMKTRKDDGRPEPSGSQGNVHSRERQPERPVDSPYLTTQGAVVYLRLPSRGALYHHIRENGLPVCRVGGGLRFDRRDLDSWLRGTTALEPARAKHKA